MKEGASLLEASPVPHQLMPRTKEARILRALERKRQSLDLEISHFKASKDDEYIAYECKLRNSIPASADELEEFPSDYSPVVLNGLDRGAEAFDHAVNGNAQGEQEEETSGSGDDHLGELDVGIIIGGRMVDTSKKRGYRLDWSKRTRAFNRGFELRNLFAPTHLPFQENSQPMPDRFINAQESFPSSELARPSDEFQKKLHLSSSATLPSTPFDPLRSPPRTGPFSSSVPRPNALQDRQSSPRSDLSMTSLRSSLKRPQTPRSSKHVLFAIDDHVLSPSTSPVAQRKDSIKPPIPFAGLTDLPKQIRRTLTLKEQEPLSEKAANTSVEQIEDVRNTLPSPVSSLGNSSPAATVASPSSIISYHQLVEPTNISSRLSREDFENVRRDDEALFSFDEEADEHEIEEIEVDKDFDDFHMDDVKAETMSGNESSPHAGSLPIEIRWPARRDPRK